MGREWYWGTGGKSSRRGGGEERDSASTPSGCMCAVFQLFDFHQFQFALHQQTSFKPNSFLPEETSIPKGAEAPRNSLELDEPSLPLTIKEDENLIMPVGIQIRTNGDTAASKAHVAPNDSSSSEIISSPGIKTPNLVARLMGLDLLPDHSYSPSHCSSSTTLGTPNLQGKFHLHHHFRPRQSLYSRPTSHRSCLDSDFTGTRSLPETPRISSARRSDVEHRLSLQINKENMSVSEELVLSRVSSLRKKELKTEEESKSPGHYARQIVKQVKESVSRKVGLDITNTARNREQGSRDELVSQFKSRKLSKALNKAVDVSSPGKHSINSSCSPRLKFLEPKNKPIKTVPSRKDHNISQSPKPPLSASSHVNISLPQNTKPSAKPNQQPVQHQQQKYQQRPIKKCKKVAEERYGPSTRLKKPLQTSDIIKNKREEQFVRPTTATRPNIPNKKCKKTPLSNDLLNNITVPTLLPVKKDPTPPTTKIPQKQVPSGQELKRSSQLSSCSNQTYKQLATHVLGAQDIKTNVTEDRSNGATNITTGDETAEHVLSSCSSQTYKQLATHVLGAQDIKTNVTEDRSNGATNITTGDETAEHEYISRILRRAGMDKDTPVSFTTWFSPSHPLDPSIFYHLEHFSTTGQLGHRCNRKLLFNLVDEILVEILRPYVNMKPWSWPSPIRHDSISHMKGSHLVDMLCTKIRSFPCADCQVLEDIDALIDKDLPKLKVQNEVAFGEAGEGIVTEIEKDLLDTLMHETVVIFLFGGCGF